MERLSGAMGNIKSGKLYLTARLINKPGKIKGTELHYYENKTVYPPVPIFADWYTNKLFLQTDFQSEKISSDKRIRKTTYIIYNIKNGNALDIKKCTVKEKDYEYVDPKKYCLN